ncbi:NAD(P) transhydrogenase subunit alpha [Parabacteroides sp. PFB2-12]|uniref:NAD(P) transhydrogenase subunit alpha n=1 Tax=unclassified Parabacteroides TaxID=2649774 RepID=UPI002473EAD4|nr:MULTISPECIES: NAD(P) transhydrogenase subunit alpha [unclassified Parabacteroides]MDH6343580.1 NAD(P) transhydrogenase subunit alpha [Parabacteroides sp. PM6-13]MDH6391439.1 NAD(P) transhydrogenase subunit alpha [Parabacteroides sp. PFB2-12]
MIIGIPKEIMPGEARVAASPETVKKFIADGATVLVEHKAGEGSFYFDEAYTAAGAEIIASAEELFNKADLILKVKEPLFNNEFNKHEVDLMHPGQYLITFIHPASPVNHEMVRQLAERGIISMTLDGIPRISRAQNMDALTSMSTCAGYKGMLLAANAMPKFMPPMFTAVGSIQPAKVLVIGVGVGGLQALATAKRLGAVTYATDIRPAAIEQAQSLGAKVVDMGIPAEMAIAEGGYAKDLPEEWLEKERAKLREVLKDMDVVFLSALVPGKIAPVLITEEMVKEMPNGSVIVDISIDQGGNCDITPAGKTEVKHGVTLIGIKNIPGMLPTSSTWMFSNNVYNLVKYLVKDGKIELDRSDEIVDSILVTIDGKVVHTGALEAMNKK